MVVRVLVVVREPPLALMGLALSTPEKAMMPPSLPVLAEKVNVKLGRLGGGGDLGVDGERLGLPVVLFSRLTSVKPAGGVMVTVLGRTAMTAISASPLAVPVGRAIVIELAWPF